VPEVGKRLLEEEVETEKVVFMLYDFIIHNKLFKRFSHPLRV
jgi:hypothetical protein